MQLFAERGRCPPHMRFKLIACAVGLLAATSLCGRADEPAQSWQVEMPIVTYWAGPPLTDKTAQQMTQGGWNLVWCTENELDVAARHSVRAQLQDSLLAPGSLENSDKRAQLDALIQRVKRHPALYSYFITDEPNATNFAGLGKLVTYLREKDPAHLAYINLFPTYASNAQLGNTGDKIAAYQTHLHEYLDKVKPALLSYDHYQFTAKGDSPDYFLNLALIRRAALESGLPFLNIVQAASWTPSMRVPNANEMRFLVYTSLAYGAQGISYYVYCCAGHTGGIANADGSPTALYQPLTMLNHDFVEIARALRALKSLGVYHAGMMPPGGQAVPETAAFSFYPPLPVLEYKPPQPLQGALIGIFGEPPRRARPTHAVVVNLDYQSEHVFGIRGPRRLEIFDPTTREWKPMNQRLVELKLNPGGGALIRIGR